MQGKAHQRPIRPALRAPLAVGDIAPNCVLPGLDGAVVDLLADAIAGHPIVLIFCASFDQDSQKALAGFQTRGGAFAAAEALIFVITNEPAKVAVGLGIHLPILLDRKEDVFREFSVRGRSGPTTIILRPNHHVVAILENAPEDQPIAALAIVERLTTERQTITVIGHPPVLIVPDVLSFADCRRLIDIYENRGKIFAPPGPALDHYGGEDYKMHVPEYGREDRIDHFLFDRDTIAFLDRRIAGRIFPEIIKAFHYRVTRYETLRIGSYQGERRGKLHGHRDNFDPRTAYRRFAVSINLNTEEFSGGDLRFPEFGDQRYRPETGAAMIFSSSLLHEALQVTAGRRLVLLAFLFG
jgi:hypothetical protein